ncbi:MAG: hypothetical protein AVDCRST_MAG65-1444, partial [uncultured Solirubrobacteraceae bacterium]
DVSSRPWAPDPARPAHRGHAGVSGRARGRDGRRVGGGRRRDRRALRRRPGDRPGRLAVPPARARGAARPSRAVDAADVRARRLGARQRLPEPRAVGPALYRSDPQRRRLDRVVSALGAGIPVAGARTTRTARSAPGHRRGDRRAGPARPLRRRYPRDRGGQPLLHRRVGECRLHRRRPRPHRHRGGHRQCRPLAARPPLAGAAGRLHGDRRRRPAVPRRRRRRPPRQCRDRGDGVVLRRGADRALQRGGAPAGTATALPSGRDQAAHRPGLRGAGRRPLQQRGARRPAGHRAGRRLAGRRARPPRPHASRQRDPPRRGRRARACRLPHRTRQPTGLHTRRRAHGRRAEGRLPAARQPLRPRRLQGLQRSPRPPRGRRAPGAHLAADARRRRRTGPLLPARRRRVLPADGGRRQRIRAGHSARRRGALRRGGPLLPRLGHARNRDDPGAGAAPGRRADVRAQARPPWVRGARRLAERRALHRGWGRPPRTGPSTGGRGAPRRRADGHRRL